MKEKKDIEFIICIDSREQLALPIKSKSIVKGLYAGDYSIFGMENLASIERKTLDDLANCCGGDRERFERELIRVAGCRYKRLLIIGTRLEIESHNYKSNISAQSVLSTLYCFEARYNIPVVFCATPQSGAEFVERFFYWIIREQLKICKDIKEVVTID